MSKLSFCFGVHNHQPIGNFGWVIEDAFERSYVPFLEVLKEFPDIRISLHFTGYLLGWMQEHRPKALDTIAELVQADRVELLTGGYYEPILPVIPDRDKLGQIARQTEFIRQRFGFKPRGMWLAERVWEPHLPQVLHDAGVEYTILDDIHFRYSGLNEDDLHGYYLTEEAGATLALFPISQKLRYSIPFEDPENTIEYLRQLKESGKGNIAIYADDGEKFGVWPETDILCFKKKWLARFFEQVSANRDWIEMKFFSEILDETKPLGRIYLPTASYSEMNEWAMPAESIEDYERFVARLKEQDSFEEFQRFVKGGFWRNFLSKYPEANQMHKRMLYTSNLVAQAQTTSDQATVARATDHLYAGQVNCPYWHGVFGGLYLPHLRGSVYQQLVQAEALLQSRETQPRVEITDFDCDGSSEIIVTTRDKKAIFAPDSGGALIELDDFTAGKNLIDVVGRRREGYHQKLEQKSDEVGGAKSIHDRVVSKEEGLEKLLSYDWYRRGMFIDHFLGAEVGPEDFASSRYAEDGDFVNQPYQHHLEKNAGGMRLTLQRDGRVWWQGQRAPVALSKVFSFGPEGLNGPVLYQITNRHSQAIDLRLGIEFALGSFTFPARESALLVEPDEPIDPEIASTITGEQLELVSNLYQYRAAFTFSRKAEIWTQPLWTVSLSEGGFEKVYQGLILLPQWHCRLEPGKSWQLELGLVCDRMENSDSSRAAAVTSGQLPL